MTRQFLPFNSCFRHCLPEERRCQPGAEAGARQSAAQLQHRSVAVRSTRNTFSCTLRSHRMGHTGLPRGFVDNTACKLVAARSLG